MSNETDSMATKRDPEYNLFVWERGGRYTVQSYLLLQVGTFLVLFSFCATLCVGIPFRFMSSPSIAHPVRWVPSVCCKRYKSIPGVPLHDLEGGTVPYYVVRHAFMSSKYKQLYFAIGPVLRAPAATKKLAKNARVKYLTLNMLPWD